MVFNTTIIVLLAVSAQFFSCGSNKEVENEKVKIKDISETVAEIVPDFFSDSVLLSDDGCQTSSNNSQDALIYPQDTLEKLENLTEPSASEVQRCQRLSWLNQIETGLFSNSDFCKNLSSKNIVTCSFEYLEKLLNEYDRLNNVEERTCFTASVLEVEFAFPNEEALKQYYQCKDTLSPPEGTDDTIYFLFGVDDSLVFANYNHSFGNHSLLVHDRQSRASTLWLMKSFTIAEQSNFDDRTIAGNENLYDQISSQFIRLEAIPEENSVRITTAANYKNIFGLECGTQITIKDDYIRVRGINSQPTDTKIGENCDIEQIDEFCFKGSDWEQWLDGDDCQVNFAKNYFQPNDISAIKESISELNFIEAIFDFDEKI